MDMTLSISIINRRWRYRIIIRKKTGVGISGNSWIEGIQRNGKGALADLSPSLMALPCDEMTVLGLQSVWITSRPFAESGSAFVGFPNNFSESLVCVMSSRLLVGSIDKPIRQLPADSYPSRLECFFPTRPKYPQKSATLVLSPKRVKKLWVGDDCENLCLRQLEEGVPIRRDSQRKSLKI